MFDCCCFVLVLLCSIHIIILIIANILINTNHNDHYLYFSYYLGNSSQGDMSGGSAVTSLLHMGRLSNGGNSTCSGSGSVGGSGCGSGSDDNFDSPSPSTQLIHSNKNSNKKNNSKNKNSNKININNNNNNNNQSSLKSTSAIAKDKHEKIHKIGRFSPDNSSIPTTISAEDHSNISKTQIVQKTPFASANNPYPGSIQAILAACGPNVSGAGPSSSLSGSTTQANWRLNTHEKNMGNTSNDSNSHGNNDYVSNSTGNGSSSCNYATSSSLNDMYSSDDSIAHHNSVYISTAIAVSSFYPNIIVENVMASKYENYEPMIYEITETQLANYLKDNNDYKSTRNTNNHDSNIDNIN